MTSMFASKLDLLQSFFCLTKMQFVCRGHKHSVLISELYKEANKGVLAIGAFQSQFRRNKNKFKFWHVSIDSSIIFRLTDRILQKEYPFNTRSQAMITKNREEQVSVSVLFHLKIRNIQVSYRTHRLQLIQVCVRRENKWMPNVAGITKIFSINH